ncbi:MAG TPA: 8-oxo-dGTP diphosphatase [Anaerolineales bacterium]|nr:8-oxo-dGTP diphosphatase [Anaerolineales bacterium]
MRNPPILATLCYIKRGDRTLMLHRNKKENDVHKGKWNGLGGKFLPGETPEDCAAREVFEESGLRAERLDLCGVITFPLFSHDSDWYVFVFIVTAFGGELAESPEGELAWIPDRDLLDLNLWEGDRIFLPWLARPEFFSARFIYEKGQFVSHSVRFYPR